MGKKEQPSPLRSLFVSCIFKDNKNPKALGFMRAFLPALRFFQNFLCVHSAATTTCDTHHGHVHDSFGLWRASQSRFTVCASMHHRQASVTVIHDRNPHGRQDFLSALAANALPTASGRTCTTTTTN